MLRETAINVVVAFSFPPGSSGAVAGRPSSSSGLFSCAEDGCVKMFSNYEELQHHLDAECHLFMEEQDTTYDTIKKKWANILSSVSLPNPCHKSKQAVVLTCSANQELRGGRLRQSKSLPGCLTTSGAT